MKNIKLVIILTAFFLTEHTAGESRLTEQDFNVMETLGRSLSVKNFAFIQSQKDLKIKETLRNLSRNNFFSVVIDLEQLERILSNKSSTIGYFERKAMIIIKGNMNYVTLLQKVSGLHLLYWMVFTDSLDPLETAYIPMNVNVFVVQDKGDVIFVKKVFHLKPGRKLTSKIIFIWPKDQSESTSIVFIENIENINFQNISLKALYYLSDDYCGGRGWKLTLDRVECFQHEIIEITANKLNFTTNLIECPERAFPYNYPNGTLSTLFQMLDKREVDLSTASYIINDERLSKYDFVWPTFTTRSMMYIKFKRRQNHWRAYMRPFDKQMWLVILLWIIFIGLLIQVFDTLRSGDFHFHIQSLPETLKSIMVSLQIFCNQGVYEMPVWNSNRLLYIMTFILVLMVYQTYSGELISSLMSFTPQIPFTDLKGYLKVRTYKLLTLQKGFHNYFAKFILKENKADHLMLDNLPSNSKEGILRLCTEKHIAFLDFRENVVQHELPCKITEIPNPLLYQSVGLGLPKNSPYREFIQREMVVLYSTGILHRMRKHAYSYVKLRQKYTSDDEYLSVSLYHIQSTFAILIMGFLISFFLFLLEIFWSVLLKQKAKYMNFRLSKARHKLVPSSTHHKAYMN